MKLNKEFFKSFKTIHLIDISNLLYISFFSKPKLEFNGKLTGHHKGLCDFMINIYQAQRMHPNDAYLFVFDSKAEYRYKVYPEYKQSAARKKSKSLAPPVTHEIEHPNYINIISAIKNCYCVIEKGYEADDLIVFFTKLLHKKHKIQIYTRDYDLFFLTSKSGVSIKNINVQEKIKKKYRIDDINDLFYIKILNGDTSDNIPPIFDLRQTKKIILEWKKAKRTMLYSKELKERKDTIIRNIKLISPIKVKKYPVLYTVEKRNVLNVLKSHGLYAYLSFLKNVKKNKHLII